MSFCQTNKQISTQYSKQFNNEFHKCLLKNFIFFFVRSSVQFIVDQSWFITFFLLLSPFTHTHTSNRRKKTLLMMMIIMYNVLPFFFWYCSSYRLRVFIYIEKSDTQRANEEKKIKSIF